MYEYEAKLLRVIDGDTVDLEIDLGLDIRVKMRCRLYEINTPERGMKGFAEAKAKLEEFLKDQVITVQTIKDKKEKYGRYLVVLYVGTNAFSINRRLIELGLAVPYKV
jgi:micrococcal nuclease